MGAPGVVIASAGSGHPWSERPKTGGMIASMTVKLAITLPDEQVAAAKRAVAEGRAASVSAYIAEALSRRSADDELLDMLAEMKTEYGEPTADDYAWAEQALGLR